MNVMGFSLNVITLSALVLGVGMMVDNSTVVLESCFRATTDTGFREFAKAAINGTGVVYQSVVGSTLTTCVVFLPLAMLSGMTGEMFRPLGFTIVFCMVASLISSITVVPLCYMNSVSYTHLAQSLTVLTKQPWLWIPPGLLIVVLVVAINFVGDALRDAVDPTATLRR